MYRRFPKKHTRVYKPVRWRYRDCKKMADHWNAKMRNIHRTIEKMELIKLSIDCSDEDIEKYLLKSQFVPRALWYEFDY